MNIVLASDDGYIDHCLTTMTSIVCNNKDVYFYILTEGFAEKSQKRIYSLCEKFKSNVSIVKINSDLLSDLPMPNDERLAHISLATYYRLFITQLLPISVEKVIYLDCDIIVRKSLDELWNIELGDYSIGAVYQIEDDSLEYAERLGYPKEYGYFNAGVLLINLNKWRLDDVKHSFFEFIKNKYSDILYHDQDILNAIFYDKCVKISCAYNMMPIYFCKSIFKKNVLSKDGMIFCSYPDYIETIKKEVYDPTLIHYAARIKPWHKKCVHPYKSEYWKYARMCGAFKNLGLGDFFYTLLHKVYRKIGLSEFCI